MAVAEHSWAEKPARHWQELVITLPQDRTSRQQLEQILTQLGTNPVLEKAKVKQHKLEVTYLLLLSLSDQELLNKLLNLDPNWTINLSRTIKKKKSL